MVRSKGLPEKSLYEVDYTHPSVVFWFFGQVPTTTKTNSKLHSQNVSINTLHQNQTLKKEKKN